MTLEYVSFVSRSPGQSGNIRYIQAGTWSYILPTLFTWNIVHPGNLFFGSNNLHNNIVTENTDVVYNIPTIHTDVVQYLYCYKFLPMKVR